MDFIAGIDWPFWLPILTAVGSLGVGTIIGAVLTWVSATRDLGLRRRLETTKVFSDISARAHGNRVDGTAVGAGEQMAAMYLLVDMGKRDKWLRRAAHKQLIEEREYLWKAEIDAETEAVMAYRELNRVGNAMRAERLQVDLATLDANEGWREVSMSHEARVDYERKRKRSESLERLSEGAGYAEVLMRTPRRKRMGVDLDDHLQRGRSHPGVGKRTKLQRWWRRKRLQDASVTPTASRGQQPSRSTTDQSTLGLFALIAGAVYLIFKR